MEHRHLQFGDGFSVLFGDTRSQAAQMTLAPKASEGGPENRHVAADQWLFVVSGSGLAIVDGKRMQLKRGALIRIERGEAHEIRNIGRRPLRTLNIYVPAAYSSSGNELAAGRSK
jgi:mannose-6-phosphate isomerase-like protein (cupin superfamily)